ncbi:uncharacterized protein PGTG_11310 [Puccinia graminis f. sp. tritici CRL 75-36-700-3]|uniref:Uncharacterized protein n=2 Tax=Puccinia graminis f. sp. tritici TaxID=56615 RepID=E3KLG6_PUCGT|nr:uncharacterized protein PGTG_11310 [Puccinia graminis f. sp. tritici CRL 75-36-700-3]EFP85141.2 hypothetical protein PGTG_11310 [Puccinia graminis f. sp. tritici CRL 75-36-700-3]
MSTLERLDLYEKVQALAAHPALKPNEQGHIQALLNDIKADYENSDDEDNTGGPEVTCNPSAQSPAGPTGSESYLAPEPQAAKDNQTPNQSPSRAPRIGEFFILPNPIGAPRTTCPCFSQFSSGNTTSPVPADVNMDAHMQDGQHSENSRSTLNTLGQTTFLTRAGNEFLESIEQNHAVLNKRVLVTPASNTASTTSLTTAVPSNSSTSAPWMDDDLAAKRARLERRGSHEDADGSTDDEFDHTDKQPSQGQVKVVLDNGLGRASDFRHGPNGPPPQASRPSEFLTDSMFRDYVIPRRPHEGTGANSNDTRPRADQSQNSSGGPTPSRSARSPSVELFVPGQHLPALEVTRWNTELSTGIPWSIESAEKSIRNISFILNNLPQLISSHPTLPEEATRSLWIDLDHTHQLCVSEGILETAGDLSLITPDMVNMDQVTQPRSARAGSHILAPNLATFFAPPKIAYQRLWAALGQAWGIRRLANVKNEWVQQANDDNNGLYTAYYHFCQSYDNLGASLNDPAGDGASRSAMELVQNFCGAMAGLAFICTKNNMKAKQAKLDKLRTVHHVQHVQMLANLLIFGPTATFTSLHKGPHMTLSNANALLELGSSVLKQKIALGITTPMPHSTLDNLRIHFLNFLIKMGFNQLDNDGVPQVNWKDVHASFYNDFSPSVIAGIFSQDIEIALAHRLV